jgi:transposase InsO family protein
VEFDIEILSDSMIVLQQINSLPWLYKPWVSARLAEIRETLPIDSAEKPIRFKHVVSSANIADRHTRLCYEEPHNIPWMTGKDLEIDETKHTDPGKTEKIFDTSDLKKEEIKYESIQNRTFMNVQLQPISLQNLVSVQLPLQPKMPKIPEDKEHHQAYYIVNELLTRHNFNTTVGILSKILQLNKKYEVSVARERAIELIVAVYQQEEADWCRTFGGHLFYKLEPANLGEPIYLQARSNQLGKEFLLLIPKNKLLMDKIIHHFHVQLHASDEYIRTQLVRSGFYLPGALPRIAKFRRNCVTCKRKQDTRSNTKMGHIGDRLTNKIFMQQVVGDFAGPFIMTSPINKRTTCKYYLLVTICDYSRYISITVVENLSTEAIIRAFQQLMFRYGPISILRSDMGTNFVGAKNRYQLIDDESEVSETTRKEVSQAARRHGLQIITRASRAPWIQGSCEKAIGTIKKCWPERKLHFAEIQFFTEMCMDTINKRPLGLSRAGKMISPLDLRPISRRCDVEDNSLLAMNDRLKKTVEEFKEAWEELYSLSIISLKKWHKDKNTPDIGSLVQVSDITNSPQLALVEAIRKDGADHPRYYKIKYVDKSGKQKSLQRTGQSLCLLLTKAELESGSTRDPIEFLTSGQILNQRKTKKKIVVKVQNKIKSIDQMVDI